MTASIHQIAAAQIAASAARTAQYQAIAAAATGLLDDVSSQQAAERDAAATATAAIADLTAAIRDLMTAAGEYRTVVLSEVDLLAAAALPDGDIVADLDALLAPAPVIPPTILTLPEPVVATTAANPPVAPQTAESTVEAPEATSERQDAGKGNLDSDRIPRDQQRDCPRCGKRHRRRSQAEACLMSQ